jgi:very-short-patch-repair endonuclease
MLRKQMTPAEQILWALLRNRGLGPKFRRQHPFGPWILDFFCFELSLAIEVDGACHASRALKDFQRDMWLKQRGVFVLRLKNELVLLRPEEALRHIRASIASQAPL